MSVWQYVSVLSCLNKKFDAVIYSGKYEIKRKILFNYLQVVFLFYLSTDYDQASRNHYS